MTVRSEVKLVKGTRRVKIHFFVHDPQGPIHTEQVSAVQPGLPPVVLGGASGYVACQPQRRRLGGEMGHNGRVVVLPVTGEVPAATCPECLATPAFKKAAEELAKALSEQTVKGD